MAKVETTGDVTLWFRDGSVREMDSKIACDIGSFVREWNRGLIGRPQQIVRVTANIFVDDVAKKRKGA